MAQLKLQLAKLLKSYHQKPITKEVLVSVYDALGDGSHWPEIVDRDIGIDEATARFGHRLVVLYRDPVWSIVAGPAKIDEMLSALDTIDTE